MSERESAGAVLGNGLMVTPDIEVEMSELVSVEVVLSDDQKRSLEELASRRSQTVEELVTGCIAVGIIVTAVMDKFNIIERIRRRL